MSDSLATDTNSPSPSGPSRASESFAGPLPPAPLLARLVSYGLSAATLAIIAFVWLRTDKLDHAPWYAPLGALVLVAMPGGVLVSVGKAAVQALAARIPGGSK